VAAALLVVAPGCDLVETTRRFLPGEPVSQETSAGVNMPADDPVLAREDDSGRTPGDAVLLLIETLNNQDWATAYAMYAEPDVDFDTAAGDWTAAGERYTSFSVIETRVTDESSAIVRVVYSMQVHADGEDPLTVSVLAPGHWWALQKVDGVWKPKWMPCQ